MDTAAPVAPGVWCCQVMPVLLSAVPGDIQVEPGKPLGEVLQEKPGGDGAAAVLAGVADVGIVAADQVLVLREVRHAPEPLAGVPAGPGQAAVPAVVGGHDAGGHIAQHGVHGSREGGDIHQVGAALRRMAQVRPSARIRRPSASALRISTVWPEKRVIRSPGSMLVGEMRFSQVGITAVTLTRTPCRARACRAAAAAAPPAMSPLMPAMEEADFRQ